MRGAVVVAAGEGRAYEMGPLRAVFKADRDETDGRYSISEWWLEPLTGGPGAHLHQDDHVFYVIEGTLSVKTGETWSDAGRGSYVLIPGGTSHDFQNRGSQRTGFISFNQPGGFEDRMQGIAEALSATDLRL